MKSSPFIVIASLAAVLGAGSLFSAPLASPTAAATPPPTPPPLGTPVTSPQPNATVVPAAATSATPSPFPSAFTLPGMESHHGRGKPGQSPTPSPPPAEVRKGIDGVWEVQIQHPDTTDYTHFKLTQAGSAVSGTYIDQKNKKFPLAGSVDGQEIRLVVSMPDGTTILLEGRLDGTTDMIGMLTTPKGEIPFTATYRPKEKWIENVTPSAGGMGGMGSGGYTPP